MNIAVIGSGYVGLATGACFAEFGVKVVCVDNDEKKIKLLKKGKAPFFEPGLDEMMARNMKAKRLSFTGDLSKAVKDALVIFIAVGTPPKGDGSPDMSFVEGVAKEIGESLNGYKVIVTKSTVPVGTSKRIGKIIEEKCRRRGVEYNFDVASNPEFLREGAAIEDFMRPNRVVIGASSSQAVGIMRDLYRPLYLIETPIVVTDVKTAELIKYAANGFLSTKISFINEIANLCEVVGADVQTVAKAIGLDQRIGPKFLHAGPGYGGSCFPKDTRALLRIGEENKVDLSVVKAASTANETQKEKAAEKILSALEIPKGEIVCVLGLSFKPNTSDIRDSPALFIIGKLLGAGVRVRTYDPVVKIKGKTFLCAKDAYDAAKGAAAVVIATEWSQFRNLDLEKLKKQMKGNLFFDLRNIYDPGKVREAGFQYFSTGRK